MAKSYDQRNKIKDKYEKIIEDKDKEISALKEKVTSQEEKIVELRKKLFEAGEGKGERNRLEGIISTQKREKKTLENKIKQLDGSSMISEFKEERQVLISRIKKLSFPNNYIYNALATKFINGLDDVIQIAYLIKLNRIEDMDFYTFVFRDDIIGLLEKMLKVILNKEEQSASNYLVKLSNNVYTFPKKYTDKIPALKNKKIITNILYLINLESTAYHGTKRNLKHVIVNKETNEITKVNKFLNLNNEDQLDAIFTLLEFMYYVFTNSDYEITLANISASWYKTYNFEK